MTEMEKAKKYPTIAGEKKKGEYIGFEKLVEKLKRKKGLNNLSLEKSVEEISTDDFIDFLAENRLDGVWMESEKAVRDPAALAAYIGRKKYGKKRFQEMAAKGKKKK